MQEKTSIKDAVYVTNPDTLYSNSSMGFFKQIDSSKLEDRIEILANRLGVSPSINPDPFSSRLVLRAKGNDYDVLDMVDAVLKKIDRIDSRW